MHVLDNLQKFLLIANKKDFLKIHHYWPLINFRIPALAATWTPCFIANIVQMFERGEGHDTVDTLVVPILICKSSWSIHFLNHLDIRQPTDFCKPTNVNESVL